MEPPARRAAEAPAAWRHIVEDVEGQQRSPGLYRGGEGRIVGKPEIEAEPDVMGAGAAKA